MAIIKLEGARNVVEAAEKRIVNVFNNGLPVYFAFSGGKDSLCLSQLLINLIQRGQIDPKQLIVYFLDEEAIYPCIEKRYWTGEESLSCLEQSLIGTV